MAEVLRKRCVVLFTRVSCVIINKLLHQVGISHQFDTYCSAAMSSVVEKLLWF